MPETVCPKTKVRCPQIDNNSERGERRGRYEIMDEREEVQEEKENFKKIQKRKTSAGLAEKNKYRY